ncbi:MAG: ABC transporter permease subunit, partial [Deltaproteobacteria bacterium]|nr:ABC transporter permease subunit [Deltaproteobacteria bacterium]
FWDIKSQKVNPPISIFSDSESSSEQAHVQASSFHYLPESQELAFINDQGQVSWIKIIYEASFINNQRKIIHQIERQVFFDAIKPESKVKQLQMSNGEEGHQVAIIYQEDSSFKLKVLNLKKEESFLGGGNWEVDFSQDLDSALPSPPKAIAFGEGGKVLVVADQEGSTHYFAKEDSSYVLKQSWQAFGPHASLSRLDFLLGGSSLLLSNDLGENKLYSLGMDPSLGRRIFLFNKGFPSLKHKIEFFDRSLRNRAFLLGHDQVLSIRYGTTGETLWENHLDFSIKDAVFSKKYHRVGLLSQDNKIHLYELQDPHPEASFKAFFGKIFYEGQSEPKYTWQSTGGSDAFEPKLSMVPLLFGSFKGTFYALLFSVPIALLAALYTSQFAHPKTRGLIKPTMEIMASLPSVILGFLAALWLAPLIEDKVPSLLSCFFLLPFGAFLLGEIFSHLPISTRHFIKEGYEWVWIAPFLILITYLAWELGPILEQHFFLATDPNTGKLIADFRLWWPQATGTSYEQRNALVVGFAMGFAVIPIIFTIAEDSLSSVPKSLQSASLALGASRWQTAFKVILPAATGGIFSSIMIGLGRAVGETMIVLMATGNTPIMDFNIFSGMRTLSANLAVELPEAPFHGTLYRTLFFGALLLFVMTFFLNLSAELLRHRIKKKFKGL